MAKIIFCANEARTISIYRKELVKRLIELNHEIIVIGNKDGSESELISYGCQFIEMHLDRSGMNPVKDYSFYRQIKKLYKTIKPDVVCNYTIKPNIYSAVAAKKLNIPVINNITGLGYVFEKDNFTRKMVEQFYRYAFKHVDTVFFQNSEDLSLFLNKKLISKSQTKIIPGSGVNLSRFHYQEKDEQYRDEIIRFIYIGRTVLYKGIREYMKAAEIISKQYPNTKFHLLGDIDDNNPSLMPREELDYYLDNHYVEYLGIVNQVEDVLKNMDCVVLPSYTEGMSNVLLEGAAMEKMLISTNIKGCREIVIPEYNGFLCEKANLPSLISAIEAYLRIDPNLKRQFGKNSREHVEKNFDRNNVINEYIQTINQFLNEALG